jgi:hypothetical protein
VADRQTYKCRQKREFMKEYDGVVTLLILLEILIFKGRSTVRKQEELSKV